MGVFVAILADLRGALELHFLLSDRCLVTSAAFHHAMRPKQWKLGLGMVESVDVGPRSRVVAGFAAEQRAIGTPLRHAILELPVMRVRVASRAAHILETERKNFIGAASRSHFVAIGARYGGVGAGEWEPRAPMFGDAIGGTVKIQDRMAAFAAILVRRGGKLVVMRILVAIGAGREFHLIDRVFTRRQMAFPAFDGNMFAAQGVCGRVVLLHAEE